MTGPIRSHDSEELRRRRAALLQKCKRDRPAYVDAHKLRDALGFQLFHDVAAMRSRTPVDNLLFVILGASPSVKCERSLDDFQQHFIVSGLLQEIGGAVLNRVADAMTVAVGSNSSCCTRRAPLISEWKT